MVFCARFGDLDVPGSQKQSLRFRVFEEWCEEAELKDEEPEVDTAKG